jgi:hypothetical protein
LGWHLQGSLLSLGLLPAGREDDPAGRQAGLGGNRAGRARQGLRVDQEATEHTDEVLKQTKKATKKAQLRSAVFGALKTADYEELRVDEISERLEGLTTEELGKVREYEKKNKNRETLIEQLDRKIRAKNS